MIDYWLIPAFITIVCMVYAFWLGRTYEAFYGSQAVSLILVMASIIISLTSWLVWSLLI